MEEVANQTGVALINLYDNVIGSLPPFASQFVSFLVLVVIVAVYVIFVWKLYRFVSKKNIIELNLSQYSKTEHPFFEKLTAAGLYLLEYIIILPFLIFFWFAVFTLFLMFLTEGLEIQAILIISAVIIAVIRITSYYREDLSKDIAKLLPFTLLAISMTKPGFFDVPRILNHFTELPGFFGNILIYLVFIIIFEIILRFFEFLFSIFQIEDEGKIKDEKEDKKAKEETEKKEV